HHGVSHTACWHIDTGFSDDRRRVGRYLFDLIVGCKDRIRCFFFSASVKRLFVVPTCRVADAVMMLDLRNTPALFFKNAGTTRHNMVYRRADGSIGWVEPN
ncbi:MAG: sigma 54 modulation/S30EA ribosomal C-terminal domain-containing protein, partial [Pseudomonadota bacterium]